MSFGSCYHLFSCDVHAVGELLLVMNSVKADSPLELCLCLRARYCVARGSERVRNRART